MVMACGVEVAVIGGGGTLVSWTLGSGVALATTKEGSPPGVVVAACACGISKDPPPLMNNRSAAAVAAPIDPALTFNPNRFVVVVVLGDGESLSSLLLFRRDRFIWMVRRFDRVVVGKVLAVLLLRMDCIHLVFPTSSTDENEEDCRGDLLFGNDVNPLILVEEIAISNRGMVFHTTKFIVVVVDGAHLQLHLLSSNSVIE